ncbi:unnamed protein product, partial [Rotaria sp. Silwood2]
MTASDIEIDDVDMLSCRLPVTPRSSQMHNSRHVVKTGSKPAVYRGFTDPVTGSHYR